MVQGDRMYSTMFYLFIAYALTSVFIQTANLPIKQFTTPIMTGLVAVFAVIGLISRRVGKREGLILTAAWALAAAGDIFFEMSLLSKTPEDAGRNFITGVALFLAAYLIFGVSFNVFAVRAGVKTSWIAAAAALSVIMGFFAYYSLKVPPGQTALVVFYTVQAVILLCGGLLSIVAGNYSFACIGILLFFSDWLVGLRAFGNPEMVPQFIKQNILILILVTYYIPMIASIDYSLRLIAKEKSA